MVVSLLLKHLKIPVETGGGMAGYGTNSSGLRNKEVVLPFLVLVASCCPAYYYFLKNLFFRAVLVSQQN